MAELRQDVDVAAYGSFITGGDQTFRFEGRVRSLDEVPDDLTRVVVEYRDVSNTVVLDAFDSGDIASPVGWQLVSDERLAPVGTGWVRVRLIATRFAGADNDGYFDALSLRSLRTPTLQVDDVTVWAISARCRRSSISACRVLSNRRSRSRQLLPTARHWRVRTTWQWVPRRL